MKKIRTVALKVLASVSVVLVVLVSIALVFDVGSAKASVPTGETGNQFVSVDGKNMSYSIRGNGDQTIVLLPGFGTSAPILDFKSLINELAPDYRVVTIEPFGYGYSDATDTDRTAENIVEEIHEAVQALGIDQYILMGHSITGVYALDYTAKYRDEVTAFVGIDSSVPGQPNMDTKFPIEAFRVAKKLGFSDVLAKLGGSEETDAYLDDAEKAEMSRLVAKNNFSDTYLNEMDHLSSNFAAAIGKTFPADLPILLFAVQNSKVQGWTELHEGQAASVDHGELVLLDGDHYLHHTKSKEIAENVNRFMGELN
ncbi:MULTISPECIES: alpha/beta hydrolase [Rhodococcus]|uniref:alpha/beta fold hydrolase n=1 Tax=Rhodococcus TaxID=1827 RepID=UPI000BB2ED05|nr:alpha/beta hydrolase [Rhodococcus erythropolis]PBJ01389.1 haloalkane dehalogenase [Rhodococcus erythropolis]UJC80593.1 alpha/beta hydrolase [Rhodococcus erythropolis]